MLDLSALSVCPNRMWEFAVALFMIKIWKDSLILTALYGLVEASSVAVFGVFVGEWVDANPRMKASVLDWQEGKENVMTLSISWI
jgi:hypothetical protein